MKRSLTLSLSLVLAAAAFAAQWPSGWSHITAPPCTVTVGDELTWTAQATNITDHGAFVTVIFDGPGDDATIIDEFTIQPGQSANAEYSHTVGSDTIADPRWDLDVYIEGNVEGEPHDGSAGTGCTLTIQQPSSPQPRGPKPKKK
jgi:hypothetical protein